MMKSASPASALLWILIVACCLPLQAHGEDELPPINQRLDAMVKWGAAENDSSIESLIDCLHDSREIEGTELRGEIRSVWRELRSHTNVEIRVSGIATHYLELRPKPAMRLLTERIRKQAKAMQADHEAAWSPDEGHQQKVLLRALTDVHGEVLVKQEFIPKTQLLLEVAVEKRVDIAPGLNLKKHSSATTIVGYVDHRREAFLPFVSGKNERGNHKIVVTRKNIVALAKAIRDSNVEREVEQE